MAVQTRRDVFQAIADPTRRQIIELVAHEAMTLNTIAEKFHISRPAISQHIKILNECGIVEIETIGRERYCKLQTKNLIPAFLWLEQYQKQWTERIDSFEKYVNKLQSKNRKYNKMAKQIFINVAVKDLQKSMDFYTALGFTNNPQFSDDTEKCMVWSENIFVMILTHEKFKIFATKPIADTKTNLAGLFSLSVDSIEEVNKIVNEGIKAGGIEPNEMRDYGFMQQRTIEDFDGHTWEVFYMDISKLSTEKPVE
jgi:uncharacterized protein